MPKTHSCLAPDQAARASELERAFIERSVASRVATAIACAFFDIAVTLAEARFMLLAISCVVAPIEPAK
jgi:hypothetical protein